MVCRSQQHHLFAYTFFLVPNLVARLKKSQICEHSQGSPTSFFACCVELCNRNCWVYGPEPKKSQEGRPETGPKSDSRFFDAKSEYYYIGTLYIVWEVCGFFRASCFCNGPPIKYGGERLKAASSLIARAPFLREMPSSGARWQLSSSCQSFNLPPPVARMKTTTKAPFLVST